MLPKSTTSVGILCWSHVTSECLRGHGKCKTVTLAVRNLISVKHHLPSAWLCLCTSCALLSTVHLLERLERFTLHFPERQVAIKSWQFPFSTRAGNVKITGKKRQRRETRRSHQTELSASPLSSLWHYFCFDFRFFEHPNTFSTAGDSIALVGKIAAIKSCLVAQAV